MMRKENVFVFVCLFFLEKHKLRAMCSKINHVGGDHLSKIHTQFSSWAQSRDYSPFQLDVDMPCV